MKKTILSVALLLCVVLTSAKNDEKIIDNYNSISIVSNDVNPFCKLIQKGDYDGVKLLISNGENVNRKSVGLTPLMFAAKHNRTDIAKLLIENGARLKTKSERGMSALGFAQKFKAVETETVIKEAIVDQKKNRKKR